MRTSYKALITALSIIILVQGALGAVIYTEAWDATDAGWATVNGDLVVTWQASGNPGGSLLGSYAEMAPPGSQPDAFRATGASSGGAFTGDYWTDLGNFYGWSFDFYAADVLPSSLYMRFSDGANTYQANLLGQVGGVGGWYTVTTPGLAFGLSDWIGPGGLSGLSNALANVQWVELRLDRNAGDAQSYALDNFVNRGDDPDPPGPGGSAIPEPATALLMLTGLLGRYLFRKKRDVRPPLSSTEIGKDKSGAVWRGAGI